jgi:phage FluMu protein Com
MYVLRCIGCQWTGRRKRFTHGWCPGCKKINQLRSVGYETAMSTDRSNHSQAGNAQHRQPETWVPEMLTVRVPFSPDVGAALIAYAAERDASPHAVVAEIVQAHLKARCSWVRERAP